MIYSEVLMQSILLDPRLLLAVVGAIGVVGTLLFQRESLKKVRAELTFLQQQRDLALEKLELELERLRAEIAELKSDDDRRLHQLTESEIEEVIAQERIRTVRYAVYYHAEGIERETANNEQEASGRKSFASDRETASNEQETSGRKSFASYLPMLGFGFLLACSILLLGWFLGVWRLLLLIAIIAMTLLAFARIRENRDSICATRVSIESIKNELQRWSRLIPS